MNLTCPECGEKMKPSLIEERKYICIGCNSVFNSTQLKLELDKKHQKVKKKPLCLCGEKMDFHERMGMWVCPKKHELERKLRYLE
jgi:hypothetical protein